MEGSVHIADIYRSEAEGQAFAPLAGSPVSAGFPSPADDYLEPPLDLNDYVKRHPEATFFVRVSGDSMAGAGINSSDILVVDRALEPRPGHIVIAVVDGEMLVKRLLREQGRWWLAPANENYPPIEIREGIELRVWGVVTHVLRTLA